MIDVAAFHNKLEQFVIPLIHPFQAGRVTVHKSVAEVVDGVEIYRRAILRFVVHNRSRCSVNRGAIRNNLRKACDAAILFLIDFRQTRGKVHDQPEIHFLGIHTQLRQISDKSIRMHRSRLHGPRLAIRRNSLLIAVGHYYAVNRFHRM